MIVAVPALVMAGEVGIVRVRGGRHARRARGARSGIRSTALTLQERDRGARRFKAALLRQTLGLEEQRPSITKLWKASDQALLFGYEDAARASGQFSERPLCVLLARS